MNRRRAFLLGVVAVLLGVAARVFGFEGQAFQMKQDFGTELLSDCALQYYYFIPCPTGSWFWAYDLDAEDIVGAWFEIGNTSMGGHDVCDPLECHSLSQLSILDFAGYGTRYPGLYTVTFDVYCSDDEGCPIGPSLWNSGPVETIFGWNDIAVEPPLSLCDCVVDPGPPPATPRIAIIARAVASYNIGWGFDNIGTAVTAGCEMHDVGCLPALYPRPYGSYYEGSHSGYYGAADITCCPPIPFVDRLDTTADATQYGCVELAWTIHVTCTGPSANEATTWSTIKSLYR